MNDAVFDASAILAIINSEPGSEKITPKLLDRAVASSVNLSEVQSKLVRDGIDPDDAWEAAPSGVGSVVPFTAEQARTAGDLIAATSSIGLSLGDQACLALALNRKAPVYTTDKSWKSLKLAIPVHLLR